MTGLFRQKNSSNILILLIYGLALKFHSLLYPLPPLQEPDDHYLYNALLSFLQPLQLSPVFYSLIAFILLYTQATLLNSIFNNFKMLAKPNYLPAMSYLLITSLFTEWNQFSSPLLINSFLIWVYSRMLALYGHNKPGTAIFNIGLLMGFVTLLYQPAVVFVFMILCALYIMRPFVLRDWLIGLLGVTTPYYFLAIYLYLNNQWSWKKIIPVLSFSLPGIPSSIFVTISIILLILPFMIGGYLVQNNLSKMLIQVRKNWSLLLIFLILSTIIILINGGNNYVKWMLCVVPIAGFHAAVYFYSSSGVFARVLHWITFAYAIYINYWL